MDRLLTLFNGCEAILWVVLAAVVGVRFRTAAPKARRVSRALAALLVAFGVSDVIEIYTGAWWRPPAQMIFKGLCLVGLAVSTARLWLLQRADRASPDVP